MITADTVREEVTALIERHGHLNVATACVRQLAGYAQEGMRGRAIADNELLRDEPLPASDVMRVAAPLRSDLGRLHRAAGHQTFCTVVTVLVLEYSLRGARAREVDELKPAEGAHGCAPPPCGGCQERLAGLRRYQRVLSEAKDNRPQGGANPKQETTSDE